MKLVILVLSVLCTLPFAALAETPTPSGVKLQKILQIKTDLGAKIALSVMLDKRGNLAGIHTNMQGADSSSQSGLTSDGIFWLKDIESNDGVALVEKGNLKVLELKGELDRSTQEGDLVVRYVTNGLWGSYGECTVNVRKNGEKYEVLNVNNKPVSNVFIETGTMGIKSLKGLCS